MVQTRNELFIISAKKYITFCIRTIPNIKCFKITFISVHFFACPKKRTKERAPRSNRDPLSHHHFPGISNTPIPSPYEIPFRKMPCSPGDSSWGFFYIMKDKTCNLFKCSFNSIEYTKSFTIYTIPIFTTINWFSINKIISLAYTFPFPISL